jgi:NADP-dependent 3-hydroxy acid dehydrogenase YdfG
MQSATPERLPKVVKPNSSNKKILKRRKALVMGDCSGIAKATVIALGQAGAYIVVNDLRGEGIAK